MPSAEVHAALSPQTLLSLRLCLVLVLLVHLPVLATVLGGAAVSLALAFLGREGKDRRYLRFSRELMAASRIDWKLLLLLGLFPVPLLGLIHELAFSWESPLPPSFWLLPAAGLIAAFFLIRRYAGALAERAGDPGAASLYAVAGILAGTVALFLLWSGFGTVVNPEKAPLIRERIGYLVSWNSLVTFLQFLALFPGVVATVILLYVRGPAGRDENADPAYRDIAYAWGRRLAWLSAVAVPVLGLLGLATLPELALSPSAVGASIAVALLSPAVLLLVPSPEKGRQAAGTPVLLVFALMLLALLAGSQAAVGAAFRGRVAAVREAPAAEGKPHEPEEPAAAAPAEAEEGRQVFETVCAGCHRFDQRVVGPPLDEVLPKYEGDPEKLKAFVRNPVKVNPEYPAMPDLGLSEEQIDAVARYLLEKNPEPGDGSGNAGRAAPAGSRP